MDDLLLIDEEPKKWLTAFQSLWIILAFFALLVWSSNWKNDKPRIFISPNVFAVSHPPLPESKPKKETKTINKDTETFEKTEIALKKKQEKDLADDLEKKRKEKELEDEKRKEKERKEKKRKKEKECEDKLAEIKGKESKKKDRKKKSCEDELADARAAVAAEERQRLADETAAGEARAARLATLEGVYIGRIVGRLEHFVGDVPDSVPLSERNESTVATFVLKLTADGDLDDFPYLEESSGYDEYDKEARRAILRAMPLPMPKEPELLESFLNMTIRIDAAGHIN